MKKDLRSIANEKITVYLTTKPLLLAMQSEFKDLAMKQSTSKISSSKVKFVNRLLQDIRPLLEKEDTYKYLDLVSDEDLPEISDVVLILSQYIVAMEAFYTKYTTNDSGKRYWNMTLLERE